MAAEVEPEADDRPRWLRRMMIQAEAERAWAENSTLGDPVAPPPAEVTVVINMNAQIYVVDSLL